MPAFEFPLLHFHLPGVLHLYLLCHRGSFTTVDTPRLRSSARAGRYWTIGQTRRAIGGRFFTGWFTLGGGRVLRRLGCKGRKIYTISPVRLPQIVKIDVTALS